MVSADISAGRVSGTVELQSLDSVMDLGESMQGSIALTPVFEEHRSLADSPGDTRQEQISFPQGSEWCCALYARCMVDSADDQLAILANLSTEQVLI